MAQELRMAPKTNDISPATSDREPSDRPGSDCRWSTVAAAVIAFLFYPMTVAPLGGASNGGALGLTALTISLVLSWRAFALNRVSPWLRRLIQLPIAALVTYLAIADALTQYRSGSWLWF